MVFNLGSLVRLLNRLFNKQTTKFTQSTVGTDYGIFHTFKRTGAQLELRNSGTNGFALISPGSTGLSINTSIGEYHYLASGTVNLAIFISYDIDWAALSLGGLATKNFATGAWVNWTKIPNTDDNHMNPYAFQFTVGSTVCEMQHFITNRGASATITAMSGTLPTSGTSRLYLNLSGMSFLRV